MTDSVIIMLRIQVLNLVRNRVFTLLRLEVLNLTGISTLALVILVLHIFFRYREETTACKRTRISIFIAWITLLNPY